MNELIKALRDAPTPQMRGAIRRGYEDAARGIEECPYEDKRTVAGGTTWSRAFAKCWLEGKEIWDRTHA